VSVLCFGSSILTVPWIELGGMATITCPKTGYSAQINFETKVVCQRIVRFYSSFEIILLLQFINPFD